MLRAIVFLGLAASVFASATLDVLVNAAASFQLRFSNNTKCSKAIRPYFKALRAEAPELLKIATGREARPPELNTFAAAFAVAGERQEQGADEATLVLLKRFSGNPDVEKARAEFDHAQLDCPYPSFHRRSIVFYLNEYRSTLIKDIEPPEGRFSCGMQRPYCLRMARP